MTNTKSRLTADAEKQLRDWLHLPCAGSTIMRKVVVTTATGTVYLLILNPASHSKRMRTVVINDGHGRTHKDVWSFDFCEARVTRTTADGVRQEMGNSQPIEIGLADHPSLRLLVPDGNQNRLSATITAAELIEND